MGLSKPIEVGDVKVWLIWFDSLGAKSSCILVKTPDIRVLIDPGAAAMQPSYPLSSMEKILLREEAMKNIAEAAKLADVIVVSHYHHDHYTSPLELPELYVGKRLLIKNPNLWINRSQWYRARLFLKELNEVSGEESFESLIEEPRDFEVADPVADLPLASSRDYGEYMDRKMELLMKGRRWFENSVKLWRSEGWIREFTYDSVEVLFADGKCFSYNSTELRFSKPLFHGLEYDRLGWVLMVTVKYKNVKVLFSSDLQGPIIEDYAETIVNEQPDVIVLDGPPTYLLGYTMNRINLGRAVENIKRILKKSKAKVIIYDHHLPRDRLFKRRLANVYSSRLGEKLITAAEWFGKEPLILELTEQK